MHVAIRALHPMDVMFALGREERGIHLLHIEPAVGHLRMAGGAGARVFWPCCAWQARQLMPSCTPMPVRSSPVPTCMLCNGRVALVAERLPLVRAHASPAARHRTSRAAASRRAECTAACAGRTRPATAARSPATARAHCPSAPVFSAAGLRDASGGRSGKAWMAAFANSGMEHLPRPAAVDGRHQIAHAAFEMHAVAAQTIVHQQVLRVVVFVEEDARVSRAVRTRPATPHTPGDGNSGIARSSPARRGWRRRDLLRQIAAHVRAAPGARCSCGTKRP